MLFGKKRVSMKSYAFKYLLTAVLLGTMFGGTSFFLRLADPYAWFGKIASVTSAGFVFVALLGSLVFFKGRFFLRQSLSRRCFIGDIGKKITVSAFYQWGKMSFLRFMCFKMSATPYFKGRGRFSENQFG